MSYNIENHRENCSIVAMTELDEVFSELSQISVVRIKHGDHRYWIRFRGWVISFELSNSPFFCDSDASGLLTMKSLMTRFSFLSAEDVIEVLQEHKLL